MKKQLFPKEFIQSSIEYYSFKITKESRAIYLTLVFSVLIFLVLLPFIKLEITKTTFGQITPSGIKSTIQSPTTGRVIFSSFEENMHVNIGDTLVKFDNSTLLEESDQITNRIKELNRYIHDLKLLGLPACNVENLAIPRYKLELKEYEGLLGNLAIKLNNFEKSLKRKKILYDKKVIAEVEFEEGKLNLATAKLDLNSYKDQRKSQWEREIINFEEEKNKLVNQLSKLSDLNFQYVVLSPVSGEIQNAIAITKGQIVHVGSTIAEISPNDDLIVTCQILPSDIGLIRLGQKGTFRIDAFNFNEWGVLEGEVTEISNNVYLSTENQPYFNVKCKLFDDHLSLKNGFIGEVKKGMTLQASFYIAQRSLFQLLYDKVDDWVNPRIASIESRK